MFRCFDFPTSLQACLAAMQKCVKPRNEEKRSFNQSVRIERELYAHRVLILGTPESGKSTLVKQMKIIYSHGFNKQELISFKAAVLDNLLTSLKFVLHGMGMLRINLSNKKNKCHARAVLSCECCVGADLELLPFVAHAFCRLWGDLGFRTAVARGHEFQLNDSARYFFENISRIIAPNYIPTETDVLRVRVRTRGVVETQIRVNNSLYRLIDVGGQRSERKKWYSYFDNVHAVLFMVALSGYDQNLDEHRSTQNRLHESLECFSSTCNSAFFRGASLVLFMNKIDLFGEKILYSGRHLRLYQPDYKGPERDVSCAAQYVTDQFVTCASASGKVVFPHFTTATERSSVQEAFQSTISTVLQHNLHTAALL
ncbi:guanine nucleotide binding protein (G protein) alpha v1 isoform X1 [Rhinichthys klamathensis goyatoka]|uniref:guanine nucleotide binding protein (G protein) alpha v1 isoform X1 n=1 Tax=Rhinichthys klamathensis goyatoka TaxID=3034132 RepID=UPI0024B5E09E|nr:guanine nucleotide binding protein (G protein) alpha v1 isoform X1 [Rhinichthys klamathensis goyatoka]